MMRSPEALEERVFDLAVVGGGIAGACVAWDASRRGLSVALVDKDDFGAATSAASSKLLHGGLRYLQQLHPGKVRESALERIYFQNIAPHLTRWVPFLVPTYRDLAKSKLLLRAGMQVYELLCAGQHRHLRDPGRAVPPTDFLDAGELQRILPGLKDPAVTGAARFHESHMYSSERMTLAFVQGAVAAGAVAANYVSADDFLVEGRRVTGLQLTDRETGARLRLRSRLVANAAGPWIRRLNRHLPGDGGSGIITAFSKGSHIVTRALTGEHAVALPTRGKGQTVIDRGGRHVFVIPWRGRSLVGTSYGPYRGELDDVGPSEQDARWLVEQVDGALVGAPLSMEDVSWAYAGIYPLVDEDIDPEVYQGTGDFRVVDHQAEDGIAGVLSVFGAKYTTARLLAERAVDRAVQRLGAGPAPCSTRTEPLPSGAIDDLDAFRRERLRSHGELLDDDTIHHLIACYGADVDGVVDLVRRDPALGERIEADREEVLAQVVWAARREQALHLDDALYRRTGAGTLGNLSADALERSARAMGEELGWDAVRRGREIERARGCFFP